MKTLQTIILVIFLLSGIKSSAQNDKYQLAIQKGLQTMQIAKSTDDFLSAANYFDRIAKVETKQWLPSYYASYCNLLAGLVSQNKENNDLYWDHALSQIAHADSLSENNSEIYTIKGYIEFMKMSVDPMNRLPFMQKSSASLQKAIELNLENPRPYLVQGQNTFYTPTAFGGGKAAAKPFLEKAATKFANFKPESQIAPDWGKERAQQLLDQCKN